LKGKRAVTMKQTNLDQTESSIAAIEAGWYVPEPGVRFKVLVSTEQAAGSYCCLDTIAQSGTGSPVHIHHNEDEHFLILEGTAHLLLGEEKIDVPAGQTITLPRGVAHAWSNKSNVPLRMIALFNPGGFDQLCVGMAEGAIDASDMSNLRTRFGLELLGPKL
jgi:mannose-6-phosphate isomerase-like protein (cupin superfamily)